MPRMNDASVDFITRMQKSAEIHVRFSLAMHFSEEKEYTRFDTLMNVYKTRVSADKKVAIEKSIV